MCLKFIHMKDIFPIPSGSPATVHHGLPQAWLSYLQSQQIPVSFLQEADFKFPPLQSVTLLPESLLKHNHSLPFPYTKFLKGMSTCSTTISRWHFRAWLMAWPQRATPDVCRDRPGLGRETPQPEPRFCCLQNWGTISFELQYICWNPNVPMWWYLDVAFLEHNLVMRVQPSWVD